MPLVDVSIILGRAQWVRTRAGLIGTEPPFSTRHIIRTVFPDISVSGAKLPKLVIEMAQITKLGDRALFYNRDVPPPLQRVGLAHGLYHLIDKSVSPGLWECNTALRNLEHLRMVPTDPLELGCDLFAGELLVPFTELECRAPDELFPADPRRQGAFDDACDGLASTFNVPVRFLRWRLQDLALLRQTHFFTR